MPSHVTSFSTLRAKSYIFRLPLFTRCVLAIIVLCCILNLQTAWDIQEWGALIPDKISLSTLHRANTYPFIHLGIIHAVLNILALTPLLERFESEYGTLTSVAMFLGPLSTFPAIIYVFVEKVIFRTSHAVMGASIWVFMLLAMEAIRTYRTNPTLIIATYHIPTWTTPLALALVTSALFSSISLLGHLCGIAIGYLFGLGYLKFLAPPEKALRWVEGKLNLLGRLPHYVSVDKTTYGRFGVLPNVGAGAGGASIPIGSLVGGASGSYATTPTSGQRLGP